MNDAATRGPQRHPTACSVLEHGVRGRTFCSGTLHAAAVHDGVLADRWQSDTVIGLAHNGTPLPHSPRLALFESGAAYR